MQKKRERDRESFVADITEFFCSLQKHSRIFPTTDGRVMSINGEVARYLHDRVVVTAYEVHLGYKPSSIEIAARHVAGLSRCEFCLKWIELYIQEARPEILYAPEPS